MRFRVQIINGNVTRSLNIDASTNAAVRSIAERLCEQGESIPASEAAVLLLSRVTVAGPSRMSSDHARNVATSSHDRLTVTPSRDGR
jgi:hypothetical protein